MTASTGAVEKKSPLRKTLSHRTLYSYRNFLRFGMNSQFCSVLRFFACKAVLFFAIAHATLALYFFIKNGRLSPLFQRSVIDCFLFWLIPALLLYWPGQSQTMRLTAQNYKGDFINARVRVVTRRNLLFQQSQEFYCMGRNITPIVRKLAKHNGVALTTDFFDQCKRAFGSESDLSQEQLLKLKAINFKEIGKWH